jgi:hypothetical protein
LNREHSLLTLFFVSRRGPLSVTAPSSPKGTLHYIDWGGARLDTKDLCPAPGLGIAALAVAPTTVRTTATTQTAHFCESARSKSETVER